MDLASMDTAEVERLEEWPPPKGALGRRSVGCLSTLNEELLLELASKCPDLFSLNVAARANPESFRETGVVGKGGKFPDTGETDEGGLALVEDLLVEGLSTRLWSFFVCKNELKTKALLEATGSGSPKVVEFWPTYFASELGGAFWVKVASFSDEKAS